MSKIKLYQKNGYVDIAGILDFAKRESLYFIFITGGRGTGKTFTTLKHMIDTKSMFVYLRRKQNQVDIINKPEFSPFKPISKMIKREIISNPVTKYNAGFYFGEWDSEKEKYIPSGEPICFSAGLTTIANLRSIGIVEDCKYLVYDEFIPEKQENAIKNEGLAFLNCVETIGRNRELSGGEPLVTICLANAMNIGNAIFDTLDLVDIADSMELKNQSYRILRDRGVLLVRLIDSPISAQKANTSLYRLSKGTDFFDMSVRNYFAFEEKGNIRNLPFNEFVLCVVVSDLAIYRHKNGRIYYCSTHISGATQSRYKDTDIERVRFKTEHPEIYSAYVFNELYFDRYATELKFKKIYTRGKR